MLIAYSYNLDEVDVPLASDPISITDKFSRRSCCHWTPGSPPCS